MDTNAEEVGGSCLAGRFMVLPLCFVFVRQIQISENIQNVVIRSSFPTAIMHRNIFFLFSLSPYPLFKKTTVVVVAVVCCRFR